MPNLPKIEILRHSLSHVLATAVFEMFPEARFGIGPSIENGFYYDFDLPRTLIPEDLDLLEEKMRAIIKANLKFEKASVSIDEALKDFKKAKQPLKVELIKDIQKENPKTKTVSIYRTGEFVDLCSGPHIDSTGEISPKAFKLTKISGAYWRGDEKNKMLQRIYGVAFATDKELRQYLAMMAEAEKRDHRKIGKELDLFLISEDVGPGLVIWTPKGAIIRTEIENLIKEELRQREYEYVYSPHIGKKNLWKTSGHWDLYRDKMYSPMKVEGVEYLVKPMNCPMHIAIYKNHMRSYRELPIRIAENATVYRFEQSGELSGLSRVRHITQDDAHIFCTPEQVKNEFVSLVDFMEKIFKIFGLTDLEMWLTTRDPKSKKKYLGDDETWDQAEKAIAQALNEKKYKFITAEGEAKFYGPSLDVMVKDAIGRKWQCTTIQVDFMLPRRFELRYIDKDGKEKIPAMIHRTILGSMERFISLIIEHFAGAFPLWLSPVQVEVIPVSEKFEKYAKDIRQKLFSENIRVALNDSNESLGKRIRTAQNQKVNYMLIVGEKEMKAKSVAVRDREKGDLGAMKVEKFLEKIEKEIEDKK